MPLDSTLLTLFVITVVIICITPGPDMIYILAHAISQGPVAGVLAASGMAIGMLVHTVAVTLGLATVMSTAPVLFDVIRYAGAAYLAYIGIRAWLDSNRPADLTDSQPAGTAGRMRVRPRTVLWRAIATNLLNPKIILFYLAFLPRFVEPSLGSVSLQLFLLGVLFVVIGLLVDGVIGLTAGRLGDWLMRQGKVSRLLDRIAGTVFVLLAARLVIN